MTEQKHFARGAVMKVTTGEDILRVEAKPHIPDHHLLPMATVVILLVYGVFETQSRMVFALLVAVVVLEILFYAVHRLFGMEEFEISAKEISVHRNRGIFRRTQTYPLAQCSDLRTLTPQQSPYGLALFHNGEPLEFGHYLTEVQSMEVRWLLESRFPEIATALSKKEELPEELAMGFSARHHS